MSSNIPHTAYLARSEYCNYVVIAGLAGSLSGSEIERFAVSLRLTNANYSDELKDKHSTQYKTMKTEVVKEVSISHHTYVLAVVSYMECDTCDPKLVNLTLSVLFKIERSHQRNIVERI